MKAELHPHVFSKRHEAAGHQRQQHLFSTCACGKCGNAGLQGECRDHLIDGRGGQAFQRGHTGDQRAVEIQFAAHRRFGDRRHLLTTAGQFCQLVNAFLMDQRAVHVEHHGAWPARCLRQQPDIKAVRPRKGINLRARGQGRRCQTHNTDAVRHMTGQQLRADARQLQQGRPPVRQHISGGRRRNDRQLDTVMRCAGPLLYGHARQ